MSVVAAAIGIGSNLGDRRATIESALARLGGDAVTVTAVSDLVETAPVGPPGQGPYLNGVAIVRTTLSPRDLLGRLLEIEIAHGRRRDESVRWGPRTLDLDLLLFGPEVIDEPGLRVPHPRLHERTFVLAPLAEVAADWVHPLLGVRIECLLADVARP